QRSWRRPKRFGAAISARCSMSSRLKPCSPSAAAKLSPTSPGAAVSWRWRPREAASSTRRSSSDRMGGRIPSSRTSLPASRARSRLPTPWPRGSSALRICWRERRRRPGCALAATRSVSWKPPAAPPRRSPTSQGSPPLSALALPPANLKGFPSLELTGLRLYRIHRAAHNPWWFSSDGTGRFDLPAGSRRGTCYLAEEPVGCFLEVFRFWTLVPEAELAARRLVRLDLPPVLLADCTSSRCRGFGLTGEIHSTPDYALTQAW